MKRIKTLDVFRGLAAYSVLLVHYTQGYRERFGHSYNPKYDFYYGYLGVEFFFLISGFVIFLTVLNSTSFLILRLNVFQDYIQLLFFALSQLLYLYGFLNYPGMK
jgi:peptidoglycan/LPS O-acetylase OafA/YrhL